MIIVSLREPSRLWINFMGEPSRYSLNVTPNWPKPVRHADAARYQVNMMMYDKTNILNKFSFGPSQEYEGKKKTAHTMEGTCLNQHRVCPIHAEPLQEVPAFFRVLCTTAFVWRPAYSKADRACTESIGTGPELIQILMPLPNGMSHAVMVRIKAACQRD